MNTLVQTTTKLTVSAFVAVVVTGVVGFAINTSSSIKAPAAAQTHEARLDTATAHHYG